MKKYILLLFFACGFLTASSQQVTSSEYLLSYDQEYFNNDLGISFSKYGVDLYRINYTTTDLEGAVDTASGLVVIPQLEDLNLALLSYSHGTVGSRYEVPSYLSFEHTIAAIYSSMGVVTIAADYLGLGDNKGVHPYVHADSEAWASHDMMLAVKDFLPAEMNVQLDDRLILTGYSQGGHAAMALHRLIESETDTEVTVSMPMSGPYSISTGMRDLLTSDEEYSVVAYLANTAISYQEVYGNIFPNGNIEEFFKPLYLGPINQFINEEVDLWQLDSILREMLIVNEGGAYPSKMVMDDILADILSDDNHPVNIALRDNDVFDWAPVADTRLLYCAGDDQVAFENSLIAKEKMHENGATQVEAINLNSAFDHTECVNPAATALVFYLLAFVEPTGVDRVETGMFVVYPNPTSGRFTIELENDTEPVRIEIFNVQGERIYSINDTKSLTNVDIDVHTGIYFIHAVGIDGQDLGIQKLLVR